jgi:predicted dehydrogenase
VTKVAVIGAGIMGSNHIRVLGTIPGCTVVAVVDPDRGRSAALAGAVGAEPLTAVEDVVGMAEAAVVATPSDTHADVGVALLTAGLDVLVEKPIATTVADAQRLIDAAAVNQRVLAVGHIERFNPVVQELVRSLDAPIHLELTRTGPFSPRISADVVLDLMIHDLDLAVLLAGSAEITRIQAMGQRVRTPTLDIVTAMLRFSNGVTAALIASRVGQTKIRRIELTQADNFVSADLIRQDVSIHRVDHTEFLSSGGARYRQTGLIEIPFIENSGEPLAQELRHFFECVRNRKQPENSGAVGLRALELALEVRELASTEG